MVDLNRLCWSKNFRYGCIIKIKVSGVKADPQELVPLLIMVLCVEVSTNNNGSFTKIRLNLEIVMLI